MRVRPLIDCIMSEIEPFLFSDLGVNIDSINHYLSVIPVLPVILFIRVRVIIICFSIFSGLDYSESFHLRHLYASGYLF